MQKNIELMEKAPVKRAILSLALPSVLAMMVQVIYGLTDTFFISQLNDPNLVAAVSLIMPFALLIQAVGNIFAIGGASFISRMLGEKNIMEAKRTCSTAFYCSILMGMFVSAVAYVTKDNVLTLLGTSPATWTPTETYMMILVLSSSVQILQIVLSGLIRSEGATKQAMLGIFIGTGANIVLDYIFILEWNWGIAGAAWATAFGNLLGTIYYLIYFKKSKTLLSLGLSFFKPDKKMMTDILSIGFPAALNAFIMGVSHIISNNIAISYGENVMAGNGIMMRLGAISFLTIMGIAQGYQPFAGYNFGAKHFGRLNAS
ncbi:MAG: MATE family efflux transporter, partial [Alphaproteobacteria bacterium]|nr:MATE family efflux transporter [Alphaproteobacteria bacterium]